MTLLGTTLQTNYFGTYTEYKDTETPVAEIVGNVRVNTLNDVASAFLYVNSIVIPRRYDLPEFMQKYDGMKVALLARKYTKSVGSKVYHKLVVIAVRVLRPISTRAAA